MVPKVPDSNKGLWYQTHLASVKSLALTLSTALTTKSKPFQKLSLKYSSFSGQTLNFFAITLKAGLILFLTLAAAHSDLDLPTLSLLNKNYLFKFEISI